MPNNHFNAEEMLEAGVSAVKKQVTSQVSATGNTVSSQLGSNPTQPSPESLNSQTGTTQSTQSQDQTTKDFVKDLYGASDQIPNQAGSTGNSSNNQQNSTLTLQGKSIDQPKTPEEAEKLAKARKSLMEQHMSTYYKPTFESPQRPQEDTAEKLDREKQEEEAKKMQELQEEKKKEEVPMAIRMSSQKAEKFRGASG